MEIYLPKEIEHYEPELRLFFDLMVRKLHVCREKGFADDKTLGMMMNELKDEMGELEASVNTDHSQFDVVMEAVDVSNQAWLLALTVLRLSRSDFKQQQKDIGIKAV